MRFVKLDTTKKIQRKKFNHNRVRKIKINQFAYLMDWLLQIQVSGNLLRNCGPFAEIDFPMGKFSFWFGDAFGTSS